MTSRDDQPDHNNSLPDDLRTQPEEKEISDLVFHYIERLNDGEPFDEREILSSHPELGPSILTELRTYLEIGSNVEVEPQAPLGTLGDYTLRRQIGRGGMGVVYDAWQNSLDRQVALKVLPPGIAADSRSSARFLREAQIAAKLNHSQIVPIYASGIEGGTPWYAMEYIEGETLAQALPRIKDMEAEAETVFGKKDRPGYFEKLAEAFAEVAEGLQHAHAKGVIHRDIKPSNLILDSTGRLRILDFGLARLEGQKSLTISGDLVGTPLYMSPEQARQRKIQVDHRTDVYSVGATMYEMLAGRPPFRGKNHADTLCQIIERDAVEPRKLNPRVPKDLETIVLKCLRKDSGDRYGTAEALAQDLRRFVRGDPIEARPQSTLDVIVRRLWRQRVRIALGVLILLLLLVTCSLIRTHFITARREAENAYRKVLRHALAEALLREMEQEMATGTSRYLDPNGILEVLGLTSGGLDDGTWLSPDVDRQSLEEICRELETAVELVSQNHEGHFLLGRALILLERREEAMTSLEQACRIEPNFIPARVLLSEILEERGEQSRADREYSTALTAARKHPWAEAWLNARTAERERRWSAAIEVYETILRLQGSDQEPYEGFAVETLVARGFAYLQEERYDLAIRDFVRACDLWPDALKPALLLGRAWYLYGKDEAANRTFQGLFQQARAISLEKADDAAVWISLTYEYLRDFEKSLLWCTKITKKAPRQMRTSRVHQKLGQLEEAEWAAREAIEDDPDNAHAHLRLAEVLIGTHEYQRAIQSCNDAIDLMPRYWRPYNVKGVALSMLDRYSEAIKALREAIDLNKDSWAPYRTAAYVLTLRGKLDEAEELAEKALSIRRTVSGLKTLGLIYTARREFDKAETVLEEALERQPNDAWIFVRLGHLFDKQGYVEKSLKQYDKALRLAPSDPGVLYNAGVQFKKHGREERAEKCLRKCADRYVGGCVGLISLYSGQKKWQQAEEWFRRACDMAPRCAGAYYHMGCSFFKQKRHSDAQDFLREAIAFDPGYAKAHVTLGYILMAEENRPEEALEHFKTAHKLRPFYASPVVNIGWYFHEKGKLNEALAWYTKAVKLRPNRKRTTVYHELVELLEDAKSTKIVLPEEGLRDLAEALVTILNEPRSAPEGKTLVQLLKALLLTRDYDVNTKNLDPETVTKALDQLEKYLPANADDLRHVKEIRRAYGIDH